MRPFPQQNSADSPVFYLEHGVVVVWPKTFIPTSPISAAEERFVEKVGMKEFAGKTVTTRNVVNPVCSPPNKV
jgi:hypothetical protein